MLTLKWYTITEVMLICIVIVLSLPSTWEVFLILVEFVKECVAKSLSKFFNICRFPPKILWYRACKQDRGCGIPSCPTDIFLALIPAITYLAGSRDCANYKKGTFPLQNVLLILTWSGIDRVKIDLIKKEWPTLCNSFFNEFYILPRPAIPCYATISSPADKNYQNLSSSEKRVSSLTEHKCDIYILWQV